MRAIRAVRFAELSPSQIASWARFQGADESLESPYFHPEFTQCVATVRDDVEVAVIQQNGESVGFFPFQRRGRHAAMPVGGRLSDYQGAIFRHDLSWNVKEVLSACDLTSWSFDHVLACQTPWSEYHRMTDLSPQIELASGFETYCSGLRKSGVDELQQTRRKARKLAREVGPLRFEFQSPDSGLLDRLITWKSEQYRRTQVTDVFSFPWTTALLHTLQAHQGENLAGTLSVLYSGDRPVALHMGMECRGLLHWWFPTYDPGLAKYSPGRILLLELLQAAESNGVHKVDLGRGVVGYKSRAMTGAVTLAEGKADLRPLARRLQNSLRSTRQWIRESPISGPARFPGRLIHQLSEWWTFR
ncbi:MAG: hypothetical protein CMJ50_09590 [Planctomycetaceae bacterium]|nr:hypothetical protein [Planctomycetaceae bacterium]